jgi:uncharacterized protein YecT (DUF1311 family)
MGRAAAALVLAMSMAHCAPVGADEFESYEPQRVESCLESAGVAEEVLRQCIGAGARPCIEAEGGATHGYVLCWSHEAGTWQSRLERAARDLNERHADRDPQRLAAANAAWQAWADAECEYWAYEEGGGVGEQVDRARCIARVTAERAIDLIVASAER